MFVMMHDIDSAVSVTMRNATTSEPGDHGAICTKDPGKWHYDLSRRIGFETLREGT